MAAAATTLRGRRRGRRGRAVFARQGTRRCRSSRTRRPHKFTGRRRRARAGHRLVAPVRRRARHRRGSHRDAAPHEHRADHVQLVRVPHAPSLLRRRRVPPCDRRLHGADGRPELDQGLAVDVGPRQRRLLLRARGRPVVQLRQARRRRDGAQHAAEHEQLAVLHHVRRVPVARTSSTRSGRRSSKGSTCSRTSSAASRRPRRRASSTRTSACSSHLATRYK